MRLSNYTAVLQPCSPAIGKRLFLFLLPVFLAGCQSNHNSAITTPVDTLLQGAEWIAASEMLPVSDSLFYLDHPAPLFRKSFRITSPVVHAELVVATAGYQTVTLNGREIPGQYLSPAWTNYSKRIFARKYDVTDWLLKGENVIGVELGNGWYNPLPLRMWGWLNLRDWLPVGQPRFILVLKVTGRNGQNTRIRSDSSWVWQSGPVIRNNVYLGTWYDARKEIDGWDTPGYSDTTWKHARIITPPGGIIEEAFFPPIHKTATLKPVFIWQTESGSWIYDLGQNFAGWIHFHAPAQRGDTLIFRYGERIYPDSTLNPMTAVCGQIKRKGVGGPGAPDIAVQKDLYIASGAVADFEPRYTFHGFRYVEIQGLHLSPGKNTLTGFRAGTDFQKAGSLKFNADWLNRIQTMVEWTLRSNYFSVPSDCPAREKFGYGGDMNQNAETFLYNFNMKSIYTKALYDWKDAMQPDGFVDTAPFVGIHYCGIAWEATFMLLQEWLYTFYGDTTLVADWYSYDREWMNKAENLLGNGLVTQGLSDHESLEPVPVELIGTVYYYKSLRIMEQFASLMHDDPGRQHYRQQANRIRKVMIDSLWSKPDSSVRNKQTWYSTFLYFNLLDGAEKDRAVKRLVDVMEANEYRHTTGIFGTPFLLETLSRSGHVQEVFNMVSRKEFPGWRYMIDHGATTLWETWKEDDNTYSQNHPMFGGVSTWFYRWLAGFQPDHPGFSRINLRPFAPNGLNHCKATYQTSYGQVTMNWSRKGDRLVYHFSIPEGVAVRFEPGWTGSYELIHRKEPAHRKERKSASSFDCSAPGKYTFEYKRY